MATFKFTTLSVRNAPPGEHSDTILPGLTISVGANRIKAFARPRIGGKRQRIPLGYFPQQSLAELRTAYRELIERLDAGAVPLPAAPHPRSPDAASLGTLLDRYQEHRLAEGGRGVKSVPRMVKLVRKYFAEYLALPARSLSRHDVRAVRDRLYARGARGQWSHVRSGISTALQWAVDEDLVEANVARAVAPAPSKPRERVLTDAEIIAVWHATFELEKRGELENQNLRSPTSAAFARLVRFLLLTGLRRGEGATLRFGDVIDSTLRLPGERTKNGKALSLKLPQLALDQLGEASRSKIEQQPARQFCFPAGDGLPIRAFSHCLDELRELSGTSGWYVHDLRRTCASGMQSLHARPDIVEAILNHSLPGVSAVAGTYLRGELEHAKAQALETWARHVQALTVNPVIHRQRAP